MDRINQLKELILLHPNDLFIRFSLAKEYEKVKIFDLAIQHYDIILDIDQEQLASYYNKGILLEQLNFITESEKCFQLGFDMAKKLTDFEYIPLFQEKLNII